MKSNNNYNIGIVASRHFLFNKWGIATKSYVYYVYSEFGIILYYISSSNLNLNRFDLVLYSLNEVIKYKINNILKVNEFNTTNITNCMDENICNCYTNISSINEIRNQKLAIFSYDDSKSYHPEFHCNLNEYCLYNQYSSINNIKYLTQAESILISLRIRINELRKENNYLKIEEPFVPCTFKKEVDLITKEIRKHVYSLDIEKIVNEYSLCLDYNYISKIGGDDKLSIWLKSNKDTRRDNYLKKLLPDFLEKVFDDSGYCNMYSMVNSKNLEAKRIDLEDKIKKDFYLSYDVNHHISSLLFDFLHNKFLESQKNVIKKLENEITIKEMEKWIVQNFSLMVIPSFSHLKNDVELSSALEKYNNHNLS